MKQPVRTTSQWFPTALVCLFLLEIRLSLQLSHCNFSFLDKTGRRAGPAGMHYAIGDFDGDNKPDLAVIEVASQRWVKNNYSIHLRLSRGADSSFGVSAPSGGVRVIARDVNGDDVLDLIVTSLADQHIVAVC